MRTRQQMIEELIPVYLKHTNKSRADIEKLLNNQTTTELDLARTKLIADGKLIALTSAQMAEAEAAANRLLQVNHKLAEAVVERQAQAAEFQAERDSRRIPEQQAHARELEEQDRAVFAQACRKFKFANLEANFVAIRNAIGAGQLRMYEIQLGIDTGEIQNLIPASEQEVQQWEIEEAKQYEAWLKTLDIQTLRRVVREQGANNATARQNAEFKTWKARELKEALEPSRPPLPNVNATGEKIDSAYLRKSSMSNYKLFRKLVLKHGASQITARLNNLEGE